MYKYILIIAACTSLFCSCLSEPVFDVVPAIEFVSITKDSMLQATPLPRDSSLTTISFQDGDGDIGGDSITVFIKDTRTGNVENRFRVIEIPIQGVSSAISGTISFPVFGPCCIYPLTMQPPCQPSVPAGIREELIYEIYIVDRAGNESNRVQVTPITLLCD